MKREKWLLCPVCGNKTRLKFLQYIEMITSLWKIPHSHMFCAILFYYDD